MIARLHLIPVADALPAVQAHFADYPDESAPPTAEELRKLVELTYQFVESSSALLDYARTVGGRASTN